MAQKPSLRPHHKVGEALRAIARDALAEARDALTDPHRSDTVAVHDFRKAMKRWRALLRMLAPILGARGSRLRHEARDRVHPLNEARDAQAALDALADLGDAISPTSIATMTARLEQRRRTAENAVITPALRTQLVRWIDTLVGDVEEWPLDGVTYADVADRLTAIYRRVRRLMPSDWAHTEPDALHELRKRVVDHRYQMDWFEPVWPRLGRIWVEEAQRLRTRLGEHCDLMVLRTLTEPHQLLAPWRSRLTPLIVQRQATRRSAAARLAGRLFAERPKDFRRRLDALWENAEHRV